MINWILIIILVLAGFLIIRFLFSRHAKHRFMMTAILVIVLLLISTFYFVSSMNNVDITTISGFGNGMKLYGGWLINSFDNIKILTGDVVGLNWRTTNKTLFNNSNISLIDSGKKAGEVVVNATVTTVGNLVKPKANTPNPITTYK